MRNYIHFRASDNVTCNKILKCVRAEIKKTPFNFSNPTSQARILDGWEEGIFSWITVNYLMGNFGQVTVGGELGWEGSWGGRGVGVGGELGWKWSWVFPYPSSFNAILTCHARLRTL